MRFIFRRGGGVGGFRGGGFRMGGFRGGGLGRFRAGRRPFFRGGFRWHRPFVPPAPIVPDPQVTWAQGCLAQSVDPAVPQDGLLGPQTRQAIRTFQTQQQMPPTGILDANTVTALQAACNPQQAAQPPAGPPPGPPPDQGAPPPGGGGGAGAGGGGGGGGRRGRQQQSEYDYGGEGEFWPERNIFRPFEFRRDERFREGGDRPWDRDHRRSWLFREAEAEYDMEAGTRPEGHASRPPGEHGPAATTAATPVARVVERPVVRPVVERVVERPIVRPIERVVVERPIVRPLVERIVERPIFRPRIEVRTERPVFRPPFEFRPGWDRERRWLPLERRWTFGRPWDRPRVLWAQSCLAQVLGPWVLQDGVWGPNTHSAVRAFQEQRQLPVTGVLDGATESALHDACGR
jgi:peptidoglycan hydrolase-like protein with peptidoglycan-binding domain